MKLFSRAFLTASLLYALFVILTINTHQPYSASAATDQSNIVISQVQIAGTESAKQDFIELYNPSDKAIDISSFKLIKHTSTGSTDTSLGKIGIGTTMPARSYYLWCNKTFTAISCNKSTTATVSDNNSVALLDNTGKQIDAVTFGAPLHPFGEGDIPATPSAGQSIIRKATATSSAQSLMPGGSEADLGNGYDSNDNAEDFALMDTSMPRNAASPAAKPLPTTTVTPSPSVSPSPSISPSPSVSVLPSPAITEAPSESPAPSESVSPSPLPSPSTEPVMTPTPKPIFNIPMTYHLRLSCVKTYHTFRILNFRFSIPRIHCKLVRIK